VWTDVIPLKDVLKQFSGIELSDREFEDVQHGRRVAQTITSDTFAWHAGLPVAVMEPLSEKECKPRKVL
jgi:hypothetical protein